MSSFDHSSLQDEYDNEEGSISEDFIVPCLRECKRYRRATYSFTSGALDRWAGSLTEIIQKKVVVEILCDMSVAYSQDEKLHIAIDKSLSEEDKKIALSDYNNALLSAKLIDVKESNSRETKAKEKIIDYLLASEQLKLKFAYPKEKPPPRVSIKYHKKMGYFEFEDNEFVAFKGSWNETYLGGGVNGEECDVYSSVKPDDKARCKKTISKVDNDWNNENKKFFNFKPSKKIMDLIRERAPKSAKEIFEEYPDLYELLNKVNSDEEISFPINVPWIPKYYKGKPFRINDHQENALDKWVKHDYKGILEHATGSGKTITAIYGLCKLSENAKTIAIIGVPFQSLADQWVDELKAFNINAIKCYLSKNNWNLKAQQAIASHQIRDPDEGHVLAMVVVNDTLRSELFQDIISEIPSHELIFIGDECHRYCRENGTKSLPDADYRLGLSATPFNDEEYGALENAELRDYFGDVCDTFTIKNALDLDILCQYKYLPQIVHLKDHEYDEYKEQQRKVHPRKDENNNQEWNMAAVSGMARIIGSAENKFVSFDQHLEKEAISGRTIVFCGDGSTELDNKTSDLSQNEVKDKERAYSILKKHNIRSNFFTYNEKSPKRRKEILSDFSQGHIQCLVSIRVLDEGIDVPEVENAFLLASSRNRRQFVQRRGRILRKSSNKEFAKLFDFICLPPEGEKGSKLVDKELERVIEMTEDCLNKDDNIKIINKLIDKYEVDENIINMASMLAKNVK